MGREKEIVGQTGSTPLQEVERYAAWYDKHDRIHGTEYFTGNAGCRQARVVFCCQ